MTDGMCAHGLMLSDTEANPFEFLESPQFAEATAFAPPDMAFATAESDVAAPRPPVPDGVSSEAVPDAVPDSVSSEDSANTHTCASHACSLRGSSFPGPGQCVFVNEDLFCTFQMPSNVPLGRLHMRALAALGEVHTALLATCSVCNLNQRTCAILPLFCFGHAGTLAP